MEGLNGAFIDISIMSIDLIETRSHITLDSQIIKAQHQSKVNALNDS